MGGGGGGPFPGLVERVGPSAGAPSMLWLLLQAVPSVDAELLSRAWAAFTYLLHQAHSLVPRRLRDEGCRTRHARHGT